MRFVLNLSILYPLPSLVIALTVWYGRDAERYMETHDTILLMKAINSKQDCPKEFWKDLRDEFMRGPPVFVR